MILYHGINVSVEKIDLNFCKPFSCFSKRMQFMDKADWLIDSLTKEIAGFIVHDEKIDFDEALRKLYSSQIFEKLADKKTALYREGAAYIYQYYLEEQK